MITVETVSANRYAPEGSEAVNMYSNGLEGGLRLTIGQLAIAVSMRSAAAYEAQSVLKMNRMTAGSNLLSRAAECMGNIADGKGDWPTMKAFLIDTLGVTVTLPDSVQSYTDRMAAIAAVKAKVDALTQSQQEEMIDLQTLVNRRDVAFSASSNIVRALGTSFSGNAANLGM